MLLTMLLIKPSPKAQTMHPVKWMPQLPLLPIALLLLLTLGLLGGCSPTEGEEIPLFTPEVTTNTDFDAAAYYAVGNYPRGLAVHHDGGGVLDYVAVSSLYSNEVHVFQNDGAGNLTQKAVLDTGTSPNQVFWGDFNGSGLPDLVVAVNGGQSLAVYLDTGAGWPATPSVVHDLLAVYKELQVLELNGDTTDDMVATLPKLNEIMVFTNNGSGAFTATPLDTEGLIIETAPSHFAAGDMDSDGDLDLAVIHTAAYKLSFWQNDGAGAFTPFSTEATLVDAIPVDVAIGNFDPDNDALADVLVAGSTTKTVTLLTGDNAGGFTPGTPVELDTFPTRLMADEDLDNDGDLDVVALHGAVTEYVSVLLNDGAGAFAISNQVTLENPLQGVSNDFTGVVADRDLITASGTKRALSVLSGDGAGAFTQTVIGFMYSLKGLQSVNAKSSTRRDIILLQPTQDRIVLLLNNNLP